MKFVGDYYLRGAKRTVVRDNIYLSWSVYCIIYWLYNDLKFAHKILVRRNLSLVLHGIYRFRTENLKISNLKMLNL